MPNSMLYMIIGMYVAIAFGISIAIWELFWFICKHLTIGWN